ncbi:MAG: FprA family A-type flavoprotein, partial [Bacteroidales bacterium]|nr:FprA family A-type flavoprotein [Bacteroidales bacterium]
YYLNLYQTWSQYKPETEGVFIAFASIYGNTAKAAHYIADCLRQAGVKVSVADLARDDQAEALEDAFRYDRMILLAASYDGGLFPPMEEFLMHLKAKTYRQRRVALVENGSWAPSAGRVMKEYLSAMKDIDLYESLITIRSAMKETDKEALKALALAFSASNI